MLDVPVPEVVLQSPCVVAIIGELKTTGMAQHVWVDRERHLGSLADALDEAVEANRTDWPAALGNELFFCTVVKGRTAAWSTSRSQCRMEAPGRVRGMRRRHEPPGPPGRGTFQFQIFVQTPAPEIWSETISGSEEGPGAGPIAETCHHPVPLRPNISS